MKKEELKEDVGQLNEIEKKGVKQLIKGFSKDESIEAVKVISSDVLWEELIRRNTKMVEAVNDIEDILGVTVDNIYPITVKAWDDIKRKYDDIENKFKRIKKGLGLKNED